jgi:hypothetical protein
VSSSSQGHVTNVEYTHGYYAELNPVRAAFSLAYAGFEAPAMKTACELGFGQGVSVSIHGAAQDVEWWGTDYNPQHSAFARSLADNAERGARLPDQSFAEFCTRTDLPDFDFIGLHGVWTWISEENEAIIVDFVRRKLKVGGVLYVSYNTFPGWSELAPLRHLLKHHVDVMGAPGTPLFERIEKALDQINTIAATNPRALQASPRALEHLKAMHKQNKNYIAHEYLTDHWNVMYYADFAKRLAPAKVNFAASANPMDAVHVVNLTQEQQQLIFGISDADYRETVRDFCIGQQFRKDLWIKGGRKLNAFERQATVRSQRIVLVQERSTVSLKIKGALGEASLLPEVYDPVLDFLADGAVRSIEEVERAVAGGVTPEKVYSAIQILVGSGALQVAQPVEEIETAAPACNRFNAKLITRADVRPDVNYLASPVTGGGVLASRFEQLFLGALLGGATSPKAWAEYAWARISAMGQKLMKDGAPIEADADNLAELTRQAEEFAEKKLPIFRSLKIAP